MPKRSGGAKPAPEPSTPKDAVRDIVETVVFVVVLVLLLKTFIAEAFVIPTGSMATTLWGYQKDVICPKCGLKFPVNCSSEVDPQQDAPRTEVTGCTCPNCRYPIDFRRVHEEDPNWRLPDWSSGDRVLVSKFLYDSRIRRPERQDVVVFKFPNGPQKNHAALNYIKRMVGKPGETIGIYYGNLYVAEGLNSPTSDPKQEFEIRKPDYMHIDADIERLKAEAVKIPPEGEPGHFRIIRKAPDQIMALSRLVYDNDQPAKDLMGEEYRRWAPEKQGPWTFSDNNKVFDHPARSGEVAWMRYRHVLRSSPRDPEGHLQPELITDFMGYNSAITTNLNQEPPKPNWVGDLILECEVKISKAPTDGDELWLELCKGVDRFKLRLQLKTGDCTLFRKVRTSREGISETKLGTMPTTKLKQPDTTYKLRFANVDERLTLWVDSEMPFGDGLSYDPPWRLGPDREPDVNKNNDLQPASIGAVGTAVKVSKVKLRRDTYYTRDPRGPDANLAAENWAKPDKWTPIEEILPRTYYVQPGHYLCLGDNSPASSDSRDWGTVPERLLLGRALVIYFPFGRGGAIK